MAVKPIPEGYHSVTPYVIVKGAAKYMEFLKRAFGAQEIEIFNGPDGSVMHAEMRVGDSILMLGDASEKQPATTSGFHLYVTDADATYRQAVQAGATSTEEVTDKFYGDRGGGVKDPAGNRWWISTHKEDVSREEMERRVKAMFSGKAGA